MGSESSFTPLLAGIGIGGYRSLAEWQTFRFDSKVTLLAGVNNSGKSNVLRFVATVLPTLRGRDGNPNLFPNSTRRPADAGLSADDIPRGFAGDTSELLVGYPFTIPADVEKPTSSGSIRGAQLDNYLWALRRLIAADEGDPSVFWSKLTFNEDRSGLRPLPSRAIRAKQLWPNWDGSTSSSTSPYLRVKNLLNLGSHDPSLIMERMVAQGAWSSEMPPVRKIIAGRRISVSETANGPDAVLSGVNLVDELAALQSPEVSEWAEAQSKWAAIQRFVGTVLDDSSVRISIPASRSTIVVETPQRVLPLDSLGSGLEQVVILAAAATVATKSVVCIEEPETNLHPQLQKQLLRYLTDETDNQYLIATHSAHLLDDKRSAAYHLRLTERGTISERVDKPHQVVGICHDLGYRPSDLLQANCVIWVEGPSDRLYVRRWLELVAPRLAEGIDYSIMFYGGKLLSHLSAGEETVDDFIQLRHLNRSSAIIIDSDKPTSRARINATKRRVRDEFMASEPAPGFAWITLCYTVENYVPPEILQSAVRNRHPQQKVPTAGQWENPLRTSTGTKFTFDKVAIARAACAELTVEHLDRFDLRAQLTKLTTFITNANVSTPGA